MCFTFFSYTSKQGLAEVEAASFYCRFRKHVLNCLHRCQFKISQEVANCADVTKRVDELLTDGDKHLVVCCTAFVWQQRPDQRQTLGVVEKTVHRVKLIGRVGSHFKGAVAHHVFTSVQDAQFSVCTEYEHFSALPLMEQEPLSMVCVTDSKLSPSQRHTQLIWDV